MILNCKPGLKAIENWVRNIRNLKRNLPSRRLATSDMHLHSPSAAGPRKKERRRMQQGELPIRVRLPCLLNGSRPFWTVIHFSKRSRSTDEAHLTLDSVERRKQRYTTSHKRRWEGESQKGSKDEEKGELWQWMKPSTKIRFVTTGPKEGWTTNYMLKCVTHLLTAS